MKNKEEGGSSSSRSGSLEWFHAYE